MADNTTTQEPLMPGVLKGRRLYRALDREFYSGMREGLIAGAIYATALWGVVAATIWGVCKWLLI